MAVDLVNQSTSNPLIIHQLEDGRWKVTFPNGLVVLSVDDNGDAVALVPYGCELQVYPHESN